MSNYTQQQINNFRAYEFVRSSGHYNMFSAEARLSSGLTKEEYIFVMENYSELLEASEAKSAQDYLLQQVDHS